MNGELFRILLVEDNAADIYLFRKALVKAEVPFELIVIEDGADALAFVRGEGKYAGRPVPDLAVLDLNLPKYEGTEVLAAMRETETLANVPVVITSSSPSPRDRAKVELFHVERYITKPPDLEDFLKIGGVLKEVLLAGKARRPPQRA
jgi:chemotaxis family two-component system response regulator Rcp1